MLELACGTLPDKLRGYGCQEPAAVAPARHKDAVMKYVGVSMRYLINSGAAAARSPPPYIRMLSTK